jgi:hypothetical protein
MALEDEEIALRRHVNLCRHLVFNLDPKDQNDISRTGFVTELLLDSIDGFLKWIEENASDTEQAS